MAKVCDQIKRYIKETNGKELKKLLNNVKTSWPVKIVAWSVIKSSLDKDIHDILIEEKPNIFDFQEACYILDSIQGKSRATKYKDVIKEFVHTNTCFLKKSSENWEKEYNKVTDAKKVGVIFCFADNDYIEKIVDFFNEREIIYEGIFKNNKPCRYKANLQLLERNILNINFLDETEKLELPKLVRKYRRFNEREIIYEEMFKSKKPYQYKDNLQLLERSTLDINFLNEREKLELPKLVKKYKRFNEREIIYEEIFKNKKSCRYKDNLQLLEHSTLKVNFLNETEKLELSKLVRKCKRFKLS